MTSSVGSDVYRWKKSFSPVEDDSDETPAKRKSPSPLDAAYKLQALLKKRMEEKDAQPADSKSICTTLNAADNTAAAATRSGSENSEEISSLQENQAVSRDSTDGAATVAAPAAPAAKGPSGSSIGSKRKLPSPSSDVDASVKPLKSILKKRADPKDARPTMPTVDDFVDNVESLELCWMRKTRDIEARDAELARAIARDDFFDWMNPLAPIDDQDDQPCCSKSLKKSPIINTSMLKPHSPSILDDAVERMCIEQDMNSKVKIDQLPEKVLLKIAGYLELPDRMKFRVNKKLEDLIGGNTKFDKIEVEFSLNLLDDWRYRVALTHESVRHQSAYKNDLKALKKGLKRWRSEHNSVGVIRIDIQDMPDRRIGKSLDALFRFESDQITIVQRPHVTFAPLDFTALLPVTKQTKDLAINIRCPSIGSIDLCYLRENMLRSDSSECRLEAFTVVVSDEVSRAFIKDCFGVTIKNRFIPDRIKTFNAEDPAGLQLYSTSSHYPEDLIHFKNGLVTMVEKNRIRFRKLDEETRGALRQIVFPVQLGFPYMAN